MSKDAKALAVAKVLEGIDKGMFGSKKFVGFQIIEWTWKLLLAYGIYQGLDSSVLLAMVGAAGTSETAFLGAQAWHDKHTKVAKMQALNGGVSESVEEIADPGTSER